MRYTYSDEVAQILTSRSGIIIVGEMCVLRRRVRRIYGVLIPMGGGGGTVALGCSLGGGCSPEPNR